MARTEKVITIFVASPADVADERAKLEEVIKELNDTWSRELGLRFELVRWETHARPGFGDDAQDVVNRSLPDDYDIFLGIMWSRFGTPTGRADSGTHEEFQKAKARYDKDPDSVELMIYFKDQPLPPSKIDPRQLLKVEGFKGSLGNEGALYWLFSDTSHFEKLLRLHLARIAQLHKGDAGQNGGKQRISQSATHAAEDELTSDDDDLGILDYQEIFEEKIAEVAEALSRISDATTELTGRLQDRTREIQEFTELGGGGDRSRARKLIALAAADLKQYSSRVDATIPLLRESFSVGMDAFTWSLNLSKDIESDKEKSGEYVEIYSSIVELKSMFSGTIGGIGDFRINIAALPRMTVEINKAKKSALISLDSLIEQIESQIKILSEAEKAIKAIIDANREGGDGTHL